MAIAGLILLLGALALLTAALLGVMPAGGAVGGFMLIAALFALGVAASQSDRLHLRHRRVG